MLYQERKDNEETEQLKGISLFKQTKKAKESLHWTL